MKRILLGVAAATLFFGQAQACTIVTSGLENYMHELAHCNGWVHPPFQSGYYPPVSFVHPFDGELTVYLTGPDLMDLMSVISFAQFDAHFIMAIDKTPPGLCSYFWKQRGTKAAQKDVDHVIGCSLR